MFRIDSTDVSGVLPAPAAANAPGYFKAGNPALGDPATVLDADWANNVQEELVAVATMRGAALAKATRDQCKTALLPTLALLGSAAGAVGAQSTPYLRGQLASGGFAGNTFQAGAGPSAHVAADGCDLSGLSSACLASDDSLADGALDSACLASRFGEASGSQAAVIAAYIARVTGTGSAAIACGDGAGDPHLVSGNNSAVLASGDTLGTDPCTVSGDRSAVIASDRSDVSSDEAAALASYRANVAADKSVSIASYEAQVGGGPSAIIASAPDGAGVQPTTAGQVGAVIASLGGQAISVAGKAAVIGSEDSQASGESSVVLASEGVEVGGAYCVGGGRTAAALGASTGGNRNNTWRIESITGNVFSDGVVGAGAADYAETFENAVPGQAIPVGSLVARSGRKVRLAGAGDRVLGVVSATPAVLGNSAPLEWAGRYKRDDFGRFERETVQCVRWPAQFEERVEIPAHQAIAVRWRDDAGVVHEVPASKWLALPQDKRPAGKLTVDRELAATLPPAFDGLAASAPTVPAGIARRYKRQIRTAYSGRLDAAPTPIPADAVLYGLDQRVETGTADPAMAYVSRVERPLEWTAVGLLGQLAVRVAAGVQVDDEIVAGPSGIGIKKGAGPSLGARIEVMEIAKTFDAARGYAIAWCLVR